MDVVSWDAITPRIVPAKDVMTRCFVTHHKGESEMVSSENRILWCEHSPHLVLNPVSLRRGEAESEKVGSVREKSFSSLSIIWRLNALKDLELRWIVGKISFGVHFGLKDTYRKGEVH